MLVTLTHANDQGQRPIVPKIDQGQRPVVQKIECKQTDGDNCSGANAVSDNTEEQSFTISHIRNHNNDNEGLLVKI